MLACCACVLIVLVLLGWFCVFVVVMRGLCVCVHGFVCVAAGDCVIVLVRFVVVFLLLCV